MPLSCVAVSTCVGTRVRCRARFRSCAYMRNILSLDLGGFGVRSLRASLQHKSREVTAP